MAAVGVGVDMVEIARIERALTRTPSMVEGVFTPAEIAYSRKGARPYERFAARFAAREATLKALGLTFGDIDPHDVSVETEPSGKPRIVLAGHAKRVADARGVTEVAVSLTHTRDLAVASCVAVTEAARPVQDDKIAPEQALRQSFREARGVLDDLERILDA